MSITQQPLQAAIYIVCTTSVALDLGIDAPKM